MEKSIYEKVDLPGYCIEPINCILQLLITLKKKLNFC